MEGLQKYNSNLSFDQIKEKITQKGRKWKQLLDSEVDSNYYTVELIKSCGYTKFDRSILKTNILQLNIFELGKTALKTAFFAVGVIPALSLDLLVFGIVYASKNLIKKVLKIAKDEVVEVINAPNTTTLAVNKFNTLISESIDSILDDKTKEKVKDSNLGEKIKKIIKFFQDDPAVWKEIEKFLIKALDLLLDEKIKNQVEADKLHKKIKNIYNLLEPNKVIENFLTDTLLLLFDADFKEEVKTYSLSEKLIKAREKLATDSIQLFCDEECKTKIKNHQLSLNKQLVAIIDNIIINIIKNGRYQHVVEMVIKQLLAQNTEGEFKEINAIKIQEILAIFLQQVGVKVLNTDQESSRTHMTNELDSAIKEFTRNKIAHIEKELIVLLSKAHDSEQEAQPEGELPVHHIVRNSLPDAVAEFFKECVHRFLKPPEQLDLVEGQSEGYSIQGDIDSFFTERLQSLLSECSPNISAEDHARIQDKLKQILNDMIEDPETKAKADAWVKGRMENLQLRTLLPRPPVGAAQGGAAIVATLLGTTFGMLGGIPGVSAVDAL